MATSTGLDKSVSIAPTAPNLGTYLVFHSMKEVTGEQSKGKLLTGATFG